MIPHIVHPYILFPHSATHLHFYASQIAALKSGANSMILAPHLLFTEQNIVDVFIKRYIH